MNKIRQIIGSFLALSMILLTTQSAHAMLLFANDDVFENTSEIFQIGSNDDAATTPLSLEFGGINTESLSWSTSQFSLSNNLNVDGDLTLSGTVDGVDVSAVGAQAHDQNTDTGTTNTIFTLDSDNAGAGADVDIIANQGSDLDGILRYDATDNVWKLSNDGSTFTEIATASNDLAAVQARRTTTYTLTTTPTDITLDTTDIENNAATVSHDDTNTDRVYVYEDGIYLISYDGTGGGTATSTHLTYAQVRKNDTTVLPGSYTENSNYQGEYSSSSATFIASLTANDFVSLQFWRDATADATQNDITFGIVKLEGIKGDDGTGGGSQDFENVYGTDADNSLVTGDGPFTINTGTGDFIVDSNDWNIDASGNFDTVGAADFSGASRLALHQGSSNPGTCAEGDIFYNTTDDTTYICTATDTWSEVGSSDADTLDTLDSTQFLRADATDTYGDGGAYTLTVGSDDTLQVDGTFDANGAVTIGDGGNSVSIDSSGWDISSAGVASGLTGITSSGIVDFNGATSFRLQEATSDPGTCTEGQLYYNTASNKLRVCTAADTWEDVAESETLVVGAFYDSTGGVDLNGAATAVGWDQEVRKDTGLTHSNTTNSSRVTLDEAGWYEVNYSVSTENTTTGRKNIRCRVRLNGTTFVTPSDSYAYSRNTTDEWATNTATTIFETTGADEYYEVVCNGEGSTGTANSVADQSWTVVKNIVAGASGGGGGSGDDFETVFANDADNSLVTGNADFTINTGTADFIVNSANWNVDASGNFDTVGAADFSGASRLALHQGSSNPGTCAEGDIFYNTTDDTTYICTAADTWGSVGSDADTLDTLDSAQFLRSDASDNFTSGTLTFDNGTTLAVNGVAAIGNSSNTVTIDSSDWDINAAGDMAGIGSISFDGNLTQSGATNISTGTGTFTINSATTVANGVSFTTNGPVSIGDNGDTVAIDSSSWDISSAGLATGLTGITSTGNIDFRNTTSFRMHQAASDPGACNEGQTYYNTTTNKVRLCSAANTWENMVSGIVIDRGTTRALSGGVITTSFNETFSSAPIVTITPNSSDTISPNSTWPYVSATSTTQFTITADTNFNGSTFNWIAIGQ